MINFKGWGMLSEGGLLASILYNVKLTVYNSSFCFNVAPSIETDWNSQICAGK